jgi:hypothetical protein
MEEEEEEEEPPGKKYPKDDVIPYNFGEISRLLDGNNQTYRPPEPSVRKLSRCSCNFKKSLRTRDSSHQTTVFITKRKVSISKKPTKYINR